MLVLLALHLALALVAPAVGARLGRNVFLLVAGIGTLVFLYCARYFPADKAGLGRFAGVLTAFAGAMLGLVLADDLILLYVFWLPVLAAAATLAALSMAGVPLLFGFVAKEAAYTAFLRGGGTDTVVFGAVFLGSVAAGLLLGLAPALADPFVQAYADSYGAASPAESLALWYGGTAALGWSALTLAPGCSRCARGSAACSGGGAGCSAGWMPTGRTPQCCPGWTAWPAASPPSRRPDRSRSTSPRSCSRWCCSRASPWSPRRTSPATSRRGTGRCSQPSRSW
ncbi:MAG: hypothetical protein ACR2K2_06045 [Mycobacteriales bacterium]